MFRIVWKTKSGYSGGTKYCLPPDVAVNWLKMLRKQNPQIEYWIERSL